MTHSPTSSAGESGLHAPARQRGHEPLFVPAARGGAEWFTCDVFDTVITRSLPRPSQVFTLVAERLGFEDEAGRHAFMTARVEAEAVLRRALTGGSDIRLDEIYAEMLRRWPDAVDGRLSAAGAVDAELQAEAECSRPWPPGLRLLEEWRSRSRFAGFMSDMYLPPVAIQRMLEHAGAWKPGDRLFTSGDLRATKASGRLFETVKNTLGIEAAKWTHLGDDQHADVTVPERLGIRGIRVPPPVESRRTRAVFAGGRRQLRIAAALNRAAEDMPSGLDEHCQTVWRLASHILAPAALWYAVQVLRAAREDRRDNLWFLARDGQIVHKAALIVNRHIGFTGGLHYVLASRQALHLPSLYEFDAEARRWLFSNADVATPLDVAARAGMDERSRDEWLDAACRYRQPDSAIADAADELWQTLVRPPHSERVLHIAARHREAALSYLRSVSDWRALAIVDIGWGANLQCSLQRLLHTRDLGGYYLGLFSRNAEVAPGAVRPFLFDFSSTPVSQWAAGVSVLECLFAGDHGGVVRYAFTSDGQARGELHDPDSWLPQHRWGLGLMHQAACRAMELLTAEGVAPETEEVELLLQDLVHCPTLKEALVLGRWPVQNLQNRSASERLAEAVDWVDVAGRFITGRPLRPSMWPAGEAALSGRARYVGYRALRRISTALYG